MENNFGFDATKDRFKICVTNVLLEKFDCPGIEVTGYVLSASLTQVVDDRDLVSVLHQEVDKV